MILSTLLYILLFIIAITLFLIIIPYYYLFQFSYKDNLTYKVALKTIIFSFVFKKTKDSEVKYFKIFGIKKEIKEKPDKKEKSKTTSKAVKNQIKEKVKKEAKK
ncbi:MAG: hypothetical protein ACOC1K_02895, partial [Nanoarchaeota archaeon]